MECDNSVNPVGNRPRLLVAEDNPSNYKLVEVLLRRDYDLLHAWNGKEAVALFSDSRPDLVLMDINMPVMDGYEALRGVREISPDVPCDTHLSLGQLRETGRVVASAFDVDDGVLQSKIFLILILSSCGLNGLTI